MDHQDYILKNIAKPQWAKEEEEDEIESSSLDKNNAINSSSNIFLLSYRNRSNNHNNNFISSRSSSSSSSLVSPATKLYLDQQRLTLPIRKHRRQILYAVENYKVVVIVGETGSGKSTQIPQYLLEAGNWSNPPFSRIVCTQPRRIAAISLAQRVADERGSEIGTEVGYTVRFDDCCNIHTCHVQYATDGMLVRQAHSAEDPLLSCFSIVMVDEAHERNTQCDLLCGILKKIQKKRDLRIIICSATINAQMFLDYFCPNDANKKKDGIIISIDGRQYPVDIFYSLEPVSNYLKSCVSTALAILEEEGSKQGAETEGDILCFLPSSEDVDVAIQLAEELLSQKRQENPKTDLQNPLILPFYGALPSHLQSRIFQKSQKKRIIFATNIAETSITIPNITHVIDSGYARIPYFDSTLGYERLITTAISQASATQRCGRAGRMTSGKCFRLYTEVDYHKLHPETQPEITRTNLSSLILTFKVLGIDNFMKFDLLSRPTLASVEHALETLYALRCINEECDLTPTGYSCATYFPTEPKISVILLNSLKYYHIQDDILTIAAILQVRNILYIPKTDQEIIDYDSVMEDLLSSHHTIQNDEESNNYSLLADFYLYTKLYNNFIQKSESECHASFVNHNALKRIKEIKVQLRKCIQTYKFRTKVIIKRYSSENNASIALRKCILSGFFFHAAKIYIPPSSTQNNDHDDNLYYTTLKTKCPIQINSWSVLNRYWNTNSTTTPAYNRFHKRNSLNKTSIISREYIVFLQMYDSKKGGVVARYCACIEGKWLKEIAPHYWT